jgi:para-nitrobenzyl esterase
MRKRLLLSALWICIPGIVVLAQINHDPPLIRTVNGMIEGVNHSGIQVFKGVPFAAPPTGDLRWKAPQPVQDWQGIRKAINFGPRPMQLRIYSDMQFRSDTISEDCLYLNVWTPSKTGKEKLPVLVYFYGGGFMAGSSDEYRYDGERMARRGLITVTANYRLGIFGFFAYPGLTKESPHHSSGNYGYLDQAAALAWVKANIEAFGGDPDKIAIAGESAGSISVSALMCSPLSKDLIAGAIGSSGSLLGALPPIPLKEAEQKGLQTAKELGAKSLKELRALNGT